MFLSELQVKGFRLFKDPTTVKLHRGLNLLVGENGCGKSSVIDAIRILLNEPEFFHRGLREEDFLSRIWRKHFADITNFYFGHFC